MQTFAFYGKESKDVKFIAELVYANLISNGEK